MVLRSPSQARARSPSKVAGSAVAVALCSAGALACSTGLTPGSTYDSPLFEFHAAVVPTDGIPPGAHPRVGVIWSDPLQRTPDVLMPATWISLTASDSGFIVKVFRPPPPEAMVGIPGPGDVRANLALGDLVLWDDADGDGAFRISGPRAKIAPPDEYLAGSSQSLVYLAQPLPSTILNFPLVASAVIGYQLVNYGCNGRISNGTTLFRETTFEVQPTRLLPELRNCMRSHSP